MKLLDQGRFWIWDESSREKDLVILDLQKKYKSQGKSIWGTEGCERCGACCYKFRIKSLDKPQFQVCPYQIKDKRGCDIQDKKPRECDFYGCWRKDIRMGTDAERLQLMRIAVDILKTKTEREIDNLVECLDDLNL
jgi:hypothetical protein